MELKTTLLMPKTSFEMRGNLSQKEPKMVEQWIKDDLYNLMVEKNATHKGSKEFMLHDGPPYANGNMHCGHMLNRLLKDFIVRYKNMSGFYCPFIPGWDTHGLPIENVITKKGINRKTTPLHEFRKKCEEFAHQQVQLQMGQIQRIGVLADFDHRYMTLQHEFEAEQVNVFAKMALDGLIFKGLKPVYWSPSSESALAEAEIEYHDVTSYAIYVAFKVVDGKGVLDNDTSFVIWTTTPWTMPANLAICVNPDFDYGVYKTEKGKFVFLQELKDAIVNELELQECELISEHKGSEFEYILIKHPMYDRTSVVILGDHVTADAGTGSVHTAPGHGEDDFKVGVKYNLPPLCPVDSKGYMMEEAGEDLKGLFYEDANPVVLKKLEDLGALLKATKITHSYPHDWRTNKPLIFRATPQWFCSIDPIREKLLNEIEKVNWVPAWGETRIHNMIHDRGDWCISRQRAWGVPIPIFYAEDSTPIIEKEVFDHVSELFLEHGSNIWFEKEAKELLPEEYTNEHSPNGLFTKENDIMDVWFDSGSSSLAVMKRRGLGHPADLYLEGSDQYRGWFNSSLIISTAVTGHAPYKEVVTHGFIQDSAGEKMSKSKGNGVDPMKMANTYGADILRLWTASVDYQSDVKFGEDMVKQVSETYRKIRNTFKFLLGNLSDFNSANDKVSEFDLVDIFILAKLEKVKNTVIKSMDTYSFANAIGEITQFMAGDLSSFYLDFAKDILYCEKKDSLRRRQVQTVLFEVCDNLLRLLTPIIPFTMEEVYSCFDLENLNKTKYAQLLDYPVITNAYGEDVLRQYDKFKTVRSDVLKTLEVARSEGNIGSAQEARVLLVVKDSDSKAMLSKVSKEELSRLFVVSTLEIVDSLEGYETDTSIVKVVKHEGHKCERCWNYVDEIFEVEDVHVCSRCLDVLNGEKHD
ncbi:MAG: isoleucine--tRNA ligase [Bacilli bacterium]